jgi:hypothetical protein
MEVITIHGALSPDNHLLFMLLFTKQEADMFPVE